MSTQPPGKGSTGPMKAFVVSEPTPPPTSNGPTPTLENLMREILALKRLFHLHLDHDNEREKARAMRDKAKMDMLAEIIARLPERATPK